MNKKLLRWIKVLVLLYCIIGIALYYLQNTFLFHPVVLERSYQYKFDTPFAEVDIPVNETDTINLVKFFPTDSVRKGVVIYFHGNRSNIGRYSKFATAFTRNDYEVWMADYPGFGKSTGERNEKKLYEMARQLYRLAASKYSKDSIVIFGKSFGTGIAAYLASATDCKQLILETPYYSIPDLFGCYAPIYPVERMATYRIPTYEYLLDVKVPITILHGTDDGVIPYRCAVKLKESLKPADRFITIEGGSHHDLSKFPVFQQTLDSLLR
ncbi:MAG: alpha/beta fold hydrolase [Ferruginibacter sp.]